jgi:hypothetical protein
VTVGNTGLSLSGQQVSLALALVSGLAISSGLMLADSIAGAGLTISGKVLAVGAGAGLTVGADTVSLTTPGTLSVSSANAAAGNHTHAITSSSNPGAAAAILASNASGYVQLEGLGIGTTGAADRGVNIVPVLTTANAYGIINAPQISGSRTLLVAEYVSGYVLDASSVTYWRGVDVVPPTLVGSGAITNQAAGINIRNLSGTGAPSVYSLIQYGPADYNLMLGYLGVGVNLNYTYVGARLNVSDTGTQLRLLYNADTAKAARWTVDSSGYLTLDVDGNQFKMDSDVRIQSANYASQLTGWGITYSGSADFRYLYADELHVKTFIADLEQALAGGQIIAKSVAILYSDFVCPAAGGSQYIYVEDLPGAADMQVFQAGDYVGLRQFSRAGGGLTVAWCWGTVSSPNTTFDGYQGWLFTRSSVPYAGAASGTINKGTLVLDFGTSGNGFYEVNAIDGLYAVNSPYAQTATWSTHPSLPTLRTRMGNLYGVTATTEYGLYAGTGAVDVTDQYLRISDVNFDIHNIDLSIHDGTREVIRLDHDDGISVWTTGGVGVLRVYTGAATIAWNGLTMSPADVMLGNATAALYWDSSASTMKIGDVDAGRYLQATGSYVSVFYDAVERARFGSTITLWDSAGADRLVLSTTGVYVGDTTEGEYLFISSAGIDFYGGGVQHGDILSSGNWWFGDTAATERIQWDSVNGLNIYNASNVAVIRAPISGNAQIIGTLEIATPGLLTAGNGDVQISSYGIRFPNSELADITKIIWEYDHVAYDQITVGRIWAERYTNDYYRVFLDGGQPTGATYIQTTISARATTGPTLFLSYYNGGTSYAAITVPAGGYVSVNSDFRYSGDLRPYRNSTQYTAHAPVWLTTPLTSTSWDGDAWSDAAVASLNLNSVFGVPDGAQAVLIELYAQDSGAYPQAGLYAAIGTTGSYFQITARPRGGGANYPGNAMGWLPVSTVSGHPTVYYQVNASGTLTMSITMRVWGYAI